ncbi:hypothetical protein BZP36_14350 [Raoultella terrigena]|nr:hypothetical protein BZP36_14350 [Raoultella terrigena]
MMIYIRRMLLWLCRQLFSLYAPSICVIIFVLIYIPLFPDGPFWPVGLFIILIIYIFARYVKW